MCCVRAAEQQLVAAVAAIAAAPIQYKYGIHRLHTGIFSRCAIYATYIIAMMMVHRSIDGR